MPGVVALTYHVDYWDYLGWKDTLGSAENSQRQYDYAKARGDMDVYTPQMIVNGAAHVIGSDRARIEGAIKDTGKTGKVMSVPVTMSLSGEQLTVSVAAGTEGTPAKGEIWLCSISRAVPISIGRGETLLAIRERVLALGAAGCYCAAFADKAHGREKPIRADFTGMELPDRFVFGYGMDIHGAWRNLPAIYAVRE